MLDKIKSGTIRVALALALVSSAYAMSNAQAVEVPMPATDPELADVIANVRVDASVKDMMNQVRAGVIKDMSSRDPNNLPLRNQVQNKLMPIMMGKILPVQLQAMADPNGGFPGIIAPPPF